MVLQTIHMAAFGSSEEHHPQGSQQNKSSFLHDLVLIESYAKLETAADRHKTCCYSQAQMP